MALGFLLCSFVVRVSSMGSVSSALGRTQGQGKATEGGGIDCQERREAGECEITPLRMARECPAACDHHLTDSWHPPRAVVEEVVTKDMCREILSLAGDAVQPGDGMGGKAKAFPFSPDEIFAGVRPRAAVEWALSQPSEGDQQAKAISWARAYLQAAQKLKRAAENVLDVKEELFLDFTQLTCRQHVQTNSTPAAESMKAHADNCYESNGECVKGKPFFHWRSHSAHLFLHGHEDRHFEGGEFYFTPDYGSPNRTIVQPLMGRMVAFTAGAENLHGITKLTRGTRCVLSVWLTDDEEAAAAKEELLEARDLLAGGLAHGFADNRKIAEDNYAEMCGSYADRPLEAAAPAVDEVEVPLASEGRSLGVRVLSDAPGPQISVIDNLLTPDEAEHFITKAEPKLGGSTVFENGKLTTAKYRNSRSAWLADDAEDAILTRVLARIEAVTGLSLASAEDLQVAHYSSENQGKYSPHLDWGQITKVSRDYSFKDGNSGARIATILIYLGSPERGGCTAFTGLNLTAAPRVGSAIFWYNLRPDGDGDEYMRHGACPVLAGNKYIATKWIHERGNEGVMAAARGLPRLSRDWRAVAARLGAGRGVALQEPLVVRRTCADRLASGDCLSSPLEMFRACPEACGEHLVETPVLRRYVLDGIASAEACEQILEFAPQAAKVGDGYRGKQMTEGEEFAGVTPMGAARWALDQPDWRGARARAVAWARAYLAAAEALRRAAVERHGQGALWHDFVHLTCRKRLGEMDAAEAPSHPPHADNCWKKGEECVKARPSYHWRSHSAVLFLHGPESGDFEGGEFFYAPTWGSEAQVRVAPRPGRAVTFAAGAENIHGVTKVSRGQRCAILIWLTEDRARAAHRDEVALAAAALDRGAA